MIPVPIVMYSGAENAKALYDAGSFPIPAYAKLNGQEFNTAFYFHIRSMAS